LDEEDVLLMGALDGIRVIDASRVLAGPYCGQIFAENGAEVIKIEPPEGDLNRRFPTMVDGVGTNFLCVNRGKHDCSINLKTAEGRQLLHEMVKTADVFIQNHLPTAAAKLGTDYETIHAINPDIIHVSVSGYGSSGPLNERPGYDQMVNAFSGIMALTGEADRPPVLPGVSALDMSTGMLAYAGAVTALLARERGQAKGQKVEVSLLNSALHLMGYRALNWLVGGVLDKRVGREGDKLVPHAPYAAKDADIMVGAGPDPMFRKLCGLLDTEYLLEDPRFATLVQRTQNSMALRQELEKALSRATAAEWAEVLDKAGIPCAPVNSLDDVLQSEQVIANSMVVDVPRRDGGAPMRTLGLPFSMNETPGDPGWAPPAIGEDTDAVLSRTLKLSDEEIAALRDIGAI
jgi:crotonobetainyl-CoA:carnitine CoA-transferase CaiB-like acyl-CoA transferase